MMNSARPETRRGATVSYVAGYGRSRSTVVGLEIGRLKNHLVAGEAHMARRSLSSDRLCTCGSLVISCPYWSRFVLPDCVPRGGLWVRLLESWWSLIMPLALLRKLMLRLSVTEGVSYAEWLMGQVTRVGELGYAGLVDTSKSTREAAGRPVLYAAIGVAVEMHLPLRPLGEVLSSVRSARDRRGLSAGKFLLLRVLLSRSLAHFLARVAAHRVKSELSVITDNSSRTLESYSGDHLIAGNRMRHGTRSGESDGPPGR